MQAQHSRSDGWFRDALSGVPATGQARGRADVLCLAAVPPGRGTLAVGLRLLGALPAVGGILHVMPPRQVAAALAAGDCGLGPVDGLAAPR
ncbi:hypothetical protein BX286_5594 [Streptomyces sp. 3211.6]|uniref:hypothetical protein n=1 Tax=Streptomyces sp. 3211.6 TaxID=1938845 RepID=UPI000F281F1F|nr:hypothetical protein [Streptomyces sp. 3211.6]RKT07531.1 hypothetical protein BX286_5594 [Streptomyces sp. 3211.6]